MDEENYINYNNMIAVKRQQQGEIDNTALYANNGHNPYYNSNNVKQYSPQLKTNNIIQNKKNTPYYSSSMPKNLPPSPSLNHNNSLNNTMNINKTQNQHKMYFDSTQAGKRDESLVNNFKNLNISLEEYQHKHFIPNSQLKQRQQSNQEKYYQKHNGEEMNYPKNYPYSIGMNNSNSSINNSNGNSPQLNQKKGYHRSKNSGSSYNSNQNINIVNEKMEYMERGSPNLKIEKTKMNGSLNHSSELSTSLHSISNVVGGNPNMDVNNSNPNISSPSSKPRTLNSRENSLKNAAINSNNVNYSNGMSNNNNNYSYGSSHTQNNMDENGILKKKESNTNFSINNLKNDDNSSINHNYSYSNNSINSGQNRNSANSSNLNKNSSTNQLAFGENGRDVSINDILMYGLKAMIRSKVPLCYFLHTLIEEYCCENLFFFLEIEQYKQFVFESAEAQLKAAQYIYITYLDASSKIEVNIDERIRREILNQLNSNNCVLPTVFDKAREAVFTLMEGTYVKFNRSDIKKLMIQELDNNNTEIYTDKHKVHAIHILVSYLDKRKRELERDGEMLNMDGKQIEDMNGPGANNSPNDLSNLSPEQLLHSSNVQRHKLIIALTHEFIRAFLELDFDDESVPGEVCVFRPPIQYIQNINEDPYKILSSSPSNKHIMKDIQISINTDQNGKQFQVITTPPMPISTFRLEGYSQSRTNLNAGNNGSKSVFKKFMKSVKLL